MPSSRSSTARQWPAHILFGLAVAFLLFDAGIKVLRLPPAIAGTVALGYSIDSVRTIGLLEITCLIVYIVPRTSLLGAILLTGYLGGAIASHMRLGHPLLTHVLFPTYIAALLWGGLYLRDNRLRALIPLRAQHS